MENWANHFAISFNTFIRVLVLLLKLLLLVIVTSPSSSRSCDPLIQQEGFRVQCKNATGVRVNCFVRAEPGTVARYGCESPYYYYYPAHAQPKTEPPLTCDPTTGIWGPPAELAHFKSYNCKLNCGVPNLGAVTSYIIKGTVTEPSDWPWHATIFVRSSSKAEFKYICGGTLVKPNANSPGFLVVTAAHCFGSTPRTSVLAQNVRVVLGTSEPILGLERNTTTQVFTVAEIVVHESYGGSGSVYQSDIALLRLKEVPRLGPNVLPACLSKNAGRPAVGRVGQITGFGVYDFALTHSQSEFHSPELRTASIPVVHPDNCSEWRSHNRVLNTAQEFCAGTDGGQNACHGDSGGGMVFNATESDDDEGPAHPARSRFYLHGIVSHSRGEWNGKAASCDTFTVFTKVRSYIDWIQESVDSSSGGPTTTKNVVPVATLPTPSRPTSTSKPNVRLLSNNCGTSTNHGGEDVSKRSDWPWQTSVMVRHGHRGLDEKDFVYSCDGSLIASNASVVVVLTAASCVTHANKTVQNGGNLRVVLGLLEPLLEGMGTHSPDAQIHSVRKIVVHSSFAESGADIALVQLQMSPELKQSLAAMPVCLPAPGSGATPVVGDVGHIGSFKLRTSKGTTSSLLRQTLTQFSVVDSEHCTTSATAFSAASHFCGGNSSILSKACTGRRGAGMSFVRLNKFYLEGVATRGKESGWLKALTCRYGTYTRVSAYVDWIYETLSQMNAI